MLCCRSLESNCALWVSSAWQQWRCLPGSLSLSSFPSKPKTGDRDLYGAPLLVLANKQDCEGAATPAEVAEAFGLGRLPDAGRAVSVQVSLKFLPPVGRMGTGRKRCCTCILVAALPPRSHAPSRTPSTTCRRSRLKQGRA